MKLLYFSPATFGGLADYARAQANALTARGVEVELLSSADFPMHPGDVFRFRPELTVRFKEKSRLARRGTGVRNLLRDMAQLARLVKTENHRHVLLGSYAEYLAPLWAGPLERLAREGVVFGAMVHDPVRDFVVGPLWWHRWSVARGYSFLREAFVHEPIALDTVRPVPGLHATVVPHGIYAFPPATATREQFCRELGVPDAVPLWLSFGHVRDGKNLDLVIRALTKFPEAFLLVAGQEQSSGQKPVAFYRDLAEQCGVASRCIWMNRFIAPEEVGNLFAASDLVLLTYSKDFRSASGVLNAAIYFQKPCLASSGQGNLQTVVAHYDLGIWVEPDQLDALVAGLSRWQTSPPIPRWADYVVDHSWSRNAEIVKERMFAAS